MFASRVLSILIARADALVAIIDWDSWEGLAEGEGAAAAAIVEGGGGGWEESGGG